MTAPTDVMIDIETLGTSPRAAILSIAAVPFQADRPVHPALEMGAYYMTPMALEQNRVIDDETAAWWQAPERAEAWNALGVLDEKPFLSVALEGLCGWFGDLGSPDGIRVWACGPDFDIAILRDALRQCEIPEPWRYSNIRDVRTICEIAGIARGEWPSGNDWGVYPPHHALGDALRQAWDVSRAYAALRARMEVSA